MNHASLTGDRVLLLEDPSHARQRFAVAVAGRVHRDHQHQHRRPQDQGHRLQRHLLAPPRRDGDGQRQLSSGPCSRSWMIDTGVDSGAAGLDGKFDCAGLYGNTCGSFLTGAPNPKYRHKLRLGFTMPNGLGISGQWRYFSSVKNDASRADCDISATATAPETSRTPTGKHQVAELLRPGADRPPGGPLQLPPRRQQHPRQGAADRRRRGVERTVRQRQHLPAGL